MFRNIIKGTFEDNDEADRVVSFKRNKEKKLMVKLAWKKRLDKSEPYRSSYDYDIVRKVCPDLLIEFYESNMRFRSKRVKFT
jgi:hypothetical protein